MHSVSELLVVTGPPGAGKSTVARRLAKMFARSALVAGDDFFRFIDQGYVAPWTPEAHYQNKIVVGAAAAAAGRLAAGGYTVTYDGVIGPALLERFGAATGLPRLHYIVLLPPRQVCVKRVRSRVRHGFTDIDATVHMYGEFAGARIGERHLITGLDSAEVIATSLRGQVLAGSFIRTIREDGSHPG